MVITTNPEVCTIYDRTDVELEEFLCFCVVVAGKTARVVQRCMMKFWEDMMYDLSDQPLLRRVWTPFAMLKYFGQANVTERLKKAGIGCQTLKGRALATLADSDLDLETCTAEDLEKIPGIGRKTSRFFILHSRKDAKCACLDVHILRWLQERGVTNSGQTPGSAKEYRRLEQEFLSRVPEGKTIAEHDLEIWNAKSRRVNV